MSDSNNRNVVDLKSARKRTTDKAPVKKRAGGSSGNGRDEGYERALRGQKGGKGSSFGNVRWFHYIQVLVLLFLVAWMMRTCHM